MNCKIKEPTTESNPWSAFICKYISFRSMKSRVQLLSIEQRAIKSRRGKRYNERKGQLNQNALKQAFYIEKDTHNGVLYTPFACVFVVETRGLEPMTSRM